MRDDLLELFPAPEYTEQQLADIERLGLSGRVSDAWATMANAMRAISEARRLWGQGAVALERVDQMVGGSAAKSYFSEWRPKVSYGE